mmetsp:Transcript_7185/g.14952  ORF Transcript_7185/g.14952 Transcript_7185/m.14952 type:complete len:209 (+) Transcript_7185:136-762(+)
MPVTVVFCLLATTSSPSLISSSVLPAEFWPELMRIFSFLSSSCSMTLAWCHSIIFLSLFLISSKKWSVPLWLRCSKMVRCTFLLPPSRNIRAQRRLTPSSTTFSFMPSAMTSRHMIVAPHSSRASWTGPAASSSSSSPSSSRSSMPIFPASGPSRLWRLSVHLVSIMARKSWIVQTTVSTQSRGMNFFCLSFLMRLRVWETSFLMVGS